MRISKANLEKVKGLKAHYDYYKSNMESFHDQAFCLFFREDQVFKDFGLSDDAGNFDRWFQRGFGSVEDVSPTMEVYEGGIVLEKAEEYEDGTADYIFSISDEYRETVGLEMDIGNATDEEVKTYIEKNLSEEV